MDDGTESPLVDHIRDTHQKGTRGFTEEYLNTMHRTLHQRKYEPDMEPEHPHTHPESAAAHRSADGNERADEQEQRSADAAQHNGHKAKDHRGEDRKHGRKHADRKHADRKHVDRYHGAGGRAAEEPSSH